MFRFTSKVALATTLLATLSQAHAWQWTMDFDSYITKKSNGDLVSRDISAGRILDNEYNKGYVETTLGSLVDIGITTNIKVDNYKKDIGDQTGHDDANRKAKFGDYGVAYDTSLPAWQGQDSKYKINASGDRDTIKQEDSDLNASFDYASNANYQYAGSPTAGDDYNPGNIFIVQSTDDWNSCNQKDRYTNNGYKKTGYCTRPNDQAGGTSTVEFSFSDTVSLASINFFDISNSEAGNTKIKTYSGNETDGYTLVETQQVYGMGVGNASDNKWGTINFSASSAISRFVIFMGGSGGFSDIQLSKQFVNNIKEVSEPKTLFVLLLVLGLFLTRNKFSLDEGANKRKVKP